MRRFRLSRGHTYCFEHGHDHTRCAKRSVSATFDHLARTPSYVSILFTAESDAVIQRQVSDLTTEEKKHIC